jgi:trehalose synthase
MPALEQVSIHPMDPRRFGRVLSDGEYEALDDLITHATRALHGRVIWNVNSTAKGGGVVEMLRPLLGYSQGAGVDARWAVISGDPEFFSLTKRIHNKLHGFEGDGGPLGPHEHQIYKRTLAANATELLPLVHPRDVVILHDPQTAGLTEPVRRTGATVIWRCHVGLDHANDCAREAWRFLLPYVAPAHAYVFSRAGFAWEGLPRRRITVIRPSIDAFSPKNADQTPEQSVAILATAGILDCRAGERARFKRPDGSDGEVQRRAVMHEDQPAHLSDRLIVQVSRWDGLKDPLGVIGGFAQYAANLGDTHLMLAGPSTEAVADDPEGAAVFAAVLDTWRELPDEVRGRVHLASLPMDDLDENASMVNALQRHASIVVQKSLAEGFGLTVAEAMWKARAVVASRIGGIRDQIVHGKSGLLLSDPRDPREFGDSLATLIHDGERAQRIGAEAHASVQEHFLGSQHLGRYFEVISRLLAARAHESDGREQPSLRGHHPIEDGEPTAPPVEPEAEDVVPNRHSASAEAALLRWRETHEES